MDDRSREQIISLHIGKNVKSKVEFNQDYILTIGTMSRKKTYSQILTVDGFYNLITCKACNIGLPHEWAKSHSVKHKVTVAFLMKSN